MLTHLGRKFEAFIMFENNSVVLIGSGIRGFFISRMSGCTLLLNLGFVFNVSFLFVCRGDIPENLGVI